MGARANKYKIMMAGLNGVDDFMVDTFAKNTIPNGWHGITNDDFCADFFVNDICLTKECAANCIGKAAFPKEENIIITMMANKRGNVCHELNSISFVEEDSDAHNYCKDKNIRHVGVKDTIEYLLIMAAITDKPIRDKIPTRPAPIVNQSPRNLLRNK